MKHEDIIKSLEEIQTGGGLNIGMEDREQFYHTTMRFGDTFAVTFYMPLREVYTDRAYDVSDHVMRRIAHFFADVFDRTAIRTKLEQAQAESNKTDEATLVVDKAEYGRLLDIAETARELDVWRSEMLRILNGEPVASPLIQELGVRIAKLSSDG